MHSSYDPIQKNSYYLLLGIKKATKKSLSRSIVVVGICGLEPQTSSLSVTRSNQLSYIPNTSPFYPIYSEKSISNLD